MKIGQIFNYLQMKSYKIYSGYIHSDFGVSYRILTYTVFASGYMSLCNLILSKYYNHIQCNLFVFTLFALSALSSILLFTFYNHTFILFLCRPLLSLSTNAQWSVEFYSLDDLQFCPKKATKKHFHDHLEQHLADIYILSCYHWLYYAQAVLL